MSTSTKLNQKHSGGQIQYTHVLTQSKEEPNPVMSMVRTQAFRVPWAPLKGHLEGAWSRRDQGATPANKPNVELPAEASAAGTVPGPLVHKPNCTPAPSFELVLEAIRQRQETKTAILEEALQRTERFQQRFWGINE